MSALARTVSRAVFGTAVAGTGFSLGRDIYRAVKRNGVYVVLLILGAFSIYLPYLGTKQLVQGYRRGVWGTIFKTIIWNVLLIALVPCILYLMLSEGRELSREIQFPLIACFPSILTGLIVGLVLRYKRTRAFKIEDYNDAFMRQHGIKETGLSDHTHEDANGNHLRFLEVGNNKIVFMNTKKKGGRAYIDIDDTGKMLQYVAP